MKRILLGLLATGTVATMALVATNAFFSDTEKSTGNTFTAGTLDLKVDNTCYYNTLANGQPNCPTPSPNPEGIVTTWAQTDLGLQHKFFWFDDVKPGDFGEDTISLHVDNDAWLRLVIDGTQNNDNNCSEPESLADPDGLTCGTAGELQQNLLFTMWSDQGQTLGFQGAQDPGECDNILGTDPAEPVIISEGPINPGGETWNLADAGGAYLLGGQTACFGVSWRLPSTVGNEVQTDSFVGDMTFQVQQHRNNPAPVW